MSARQLSQSLSADLVNHLLARLNLNQEELATRLDVSPAFLSRVRSGQRALTIAHLQKIEDVTREPLGAILLAIRKPHASEDPRWSKLRSMAREGLEAATALERAIRSRQTAGARKN